MKDKSKYRIAMMPITHGYYCPRCKRVHRPFTKVHQEHWAYSVGE